MNRKKQHCTRCVRTAYYSPPPRSHCSVCTPPEELCRFFRFSIRVRDLEKIKANHKDVSAYLRELVARDLVASCESENKPGGNV